MALPAHIEAELRFTRQNAVASCLLYYVIPNGDPELDQMGQIADLIHTHLSTSVRACLEPTTFFSGVNCIYLTNDVRWEGTSSEDPQAGTAPAGDVLPEEDAVVIQRRTGLPGRGRRGRIFMPFVPEAFALDSKLTAAALVAYRTLAGQIAASPTPLEGDLPVLLPRQPAWKANMLLPIISCRVLDNTCSRRDRRTPKRMFAIGGMAGNVG